MKDTESETKSEHDTAPTVLPFATFADLRQRVSDTSWLWPGHIPRGHTTIIAGDPGVGKSLLVLDLIRRCLEGGEWPDGLPCQRLETVMIVDTEGTHGVALTRLQNLGIPLNRVLLPVPSDVDPLQDVLLDKTESWVSFHEVVTKARPGLVVIDSLCGVSGRDEDKAADMTKVMGKLQRLARDTQASILTNHHLRKPSEKQGPAGLTLDRIRGSTAITANARAVFGIEPANPTERDGVRRLIMLKSNLGPLCDPLGFVLDEERIEWVPLPEAIEIKGQFDKAVDFLQQHLASGQVKVKEMQARAMASNISWRAIERAKRHLCVVSQKQTGAKDSPWVWSLPRAHEAAA